MAPISFLELPAELRVNIYKEFFAGLKVYLRCFRKCDRIITGRQFKSNGHGYILAPEVKSAPYLALLLTSSHIHNECLPALFTVTLFHATFDCMKQSCPYLPLRVSRQTQLFDKVQRIFCRETNLPLLKRRQDQFDAVTVFIKWETWAYWIGYRPSFLNTQKHTVPTQRLRELIRSKSVRLVLVRDSESGLRIKHSFLYVGGAVHLPDQDLQQITFEVKGSIVVTGVEEERVKDSEAAIRECFGIASKRMIQYKVMLPSNPDSEESKDSIFDLTA